MELKFFWLFSMRFLQNSLIHVNFRHCFANSIKKLLEISKKRIGFIKKSIFSSVLMPKLRIFPFWLFRKFISGWNFVKNMRETSKCA